jgi:hypothetical protein
MRPLWFLISFPQVHLPSELGRSSIALTRDGPASQDAQLRQAAFHHVNRLSSLRDGVLDSADLAGGFEFGGECIPLINSTRDLQASADGVAAVHPELSG